MNQFICLFLPAFLAMTKKDTQKSLTYFIRKYALYTLAINFCMALFLHIYHYLTNNYDEVFTTQYTLKYLAVSCLLTKMLSFLKKNIKITIRHENRQKNPKHR